MVKPVVYGSEETLSPLLNTAETNTTEAPARPIHHLNEPDPVLTKYLCLYLVSSRLKSTVNDTPVASDRKMNLETSSCERPQETTMNLITKQGDHNSVLAITEPSVFGVAGIWIMVSPTSG